MKNTTEGKQPKTNPQILHPQNKYRVYCQLVEQSVYQAVQKKISLRTVLSSEDALSAIACQPYSWRTLLPSYDGSSGID